LATSEVKQVLHKLEVAQPADEEKKALKSKTRLVSLLLVEHSAFFSTSKPFNSFPSEKELFLQGVDLLQTNFYVPVN